jgi:alpha-amylase
MKTVCLYFQVHQPLRLKRYRFFNIGQDHYYYDDFSNETILQKVATKCYLPTNKLLLDLIKEFDGKFKVSFSISGVVLDQFEVYAPEVIESFQELADTGHVEFLAETNAHSLASLASKEEFFHQIQIHDTKIQKYFNQKPTVFRNTELIYSDEIGATIAELGYQAMLTEGAKHVLGWKSPNYLYANAINPKLKLLLKNFKLSDDIAFRFSNQAWNEWPLTAEKYTNWIKELPAEEEIVNLFMDYETFGEHQWAETGIFDFLKALPGVMLEQGGINFQTPSEIVKNFQPVSAIHVPHPISWADEERDLTAWLGNAIQDEAFEKLYSLADKIQLCNDEQLQKDWQYLQSSDHLYYMCTKLFSDGDVHSYFTPYESPYDAFINYMNVISDLSLRLTAAMPQTGHEKEISRMNEKLNEQKLLIEEYKKRIGLLKERKRSSSRKKISTTGKQKAVRKTVTKKKSGK